MDKSKVYTTALISLDTSTPEILMTSIRKVGKTVKTANKFINQTKKKFYKILVKMLIHLQIKDKIVEEIV